MRPWWQSCFNRNQISNNELIKYIISTKFFQLYCKYSKALILLFIKSFRSQSQNFRSWSIIGAIGKRGEAFDSNFETVRCRSSRNTTRSHHYRITRCFAAQFCNRAIPSRWILSRYYARMSYVLCPCSMILCPRAPNSRIFILDYSFYRCFWS